jgi:murein DD-endopeptidase MepM/ murein hydrolase activator NlpD
MKARPAPGHRARPPHLRARLLVTAAVLLAALAAPSTAAAQDCNPSLSACSGIQKAQDAAASNRQQLQDIQSKLSDVRARMAALRRLISALQIQVAQQQAAIDGTRRQVDELDRQIRFTEADLERRQAHLDVRQTLLGERVRALDKQGALDYLELVVTAQSFSQLVDRIGLAERVVASDHQLVQQLNRDRQDVAAAQGRLNERRAAQAQLLDVEQRQKAELDQEEQVQQAALGAQAALEAQYESQRQALEQQQAAISSQLAALQALYQQQLARLTPPAPPRPPQPGGQGNTGGRPVSGFIWPEVSHVIGQYFGCTDYPFEPYDPNCPSRHFHSGVDIDGPAGTPIHAAAAGIVTTYSDAGGYGYHVILVHAGGYATLYGHLSSFAVGSGQLVEQSQVIGYEGSTGNSTGPHLHFEIRLNGAYQDPCGYVAC